MPSKIRVLDVTKRYGSIEALKSASFDVEGGDTVSLVGVNGSGKTSMLRILAGLDEPSEGDIILGNMKMRPKDLRRLSTMVFQKNVMFNTSVYENVAFGLKVRGLSDDEIEVRVSEALDSVGLKGFQKRKARRLSYGEQQRVSLARAFAIRPEILLLDEPTSNLDPSNAMIIEDAIRSIWRRGICTVILATHNLHQARRLSDRIIHIHSGRVLEYATPEEFFNNPRNEVTRRFVNGELQF
ncbi:MAG: phosphate ABC transporter ATP-binding protein [Candidatus Bathyarchaeia archaeon]|nr:phosphate ABC transporter ATP-binding protein [Candidatus Bathyarchaeota archaeon]